MSIEIIGTKDQYGHPRIAINGEPHSIPPEVVEELVLLRNLVAVYEQYVAESTTAALQAAKTMQARRQALGVHT